MNFIQFYSSQNCLPSTLINTTAGIAIDSGNAGSSWGPANAFISSGTWGGRADANGVFWIGMNFTKAIPVQCVVLNQGSFHFASRLSIQAYDAGIWRTVWETNGLLGGANVIQKP